MALITGGDSGIGLATARSITIDFASSLIESGPSRFSFPSIEYCVVRRPADAR